MQPRGKPYFWVTWLTEILSGHDLCEWKVWMKGHYRDVPMLPRDFDMAQWNEEHTAYLGELRKEYGEQAERVLVEGQTEWKIEGKTAIVAGKMDLITFTPNLVVDAKTGKQKDAHVPQMKLYLFAIERGAVAGIPPKTPFSAVLRYRTGESVDVPGVDANFKQRFFELMQRLGSNVEPKQVPSAGECRFCDLAECPARVGVHPAARVDEF